MADNFDPIVITDVSSLPEYTVYNFEDDETDDKDSSSNSEESYPSLSEAQLLPNVENENEDQPSLLPK